MTTHAMKYSIILKPMAPTANQTAIEQKDWLENDDATLLGSVRY